MWCAGARRPVRHHPQTIFARGYIVFWKSFASEEEQNVLADDGGP